MTEIQKRDLSFRAKFIIYILIIGSIAYFLFKSSKEREIKEQRDQEVVAPFNDKAEMYLKKLRFSGVKKPATGKIIYIDSKTRKVDKFSEHNLHRSNQPENPDDVDSVILYSCEYEHVGTYSTGIKALQHVCDFTVIDVKTSTWSVWGEFKGEMPPAEIRRKVGSSYDEKGPSAHFEFNRAGGLSLK